MRRGVFALLALVAGISPALAIDWPSPGGNTLEVKSGGVTASFPAPTWIDQASPDENRMDDVNVRATWRVLKGFDLVAQQLVASITDAGHWDLGLMSYLSDVFFDDCDYRIEKDLDLPADSKTLQLTYALCGYDFGSGSGGMLLGLTKEAGPELLLDLWYLVPMAPFKISNEAEWPMSAADLEATMRALDAAVVVSLD